MATYQELRARSQQVRDEQNIGGNTALRVGQLLMDIVKYFYDNDAAASEYLQQHFAMVNDGTQLLNWKQSPIVILHTMGETYDEGDFSALSQGENYYRAGFIMEANGQGGGINGETPKANVLYVNLANDTLYTWNGASFDAITSGGGGGSISGDDILKNAYYLNGNLVLVFETESGDKTVSIPVNFDASNYVPTSRTVNGKALRNNITLSQSDIPGLVAALAGKISGIKTSDNTPLTPDSNGIVTLPPAGSTISPATAAPVMDGTANVGSSAKYAREDHVHPHDTSKQDVLTFDNAPTAGSNNPVKSGGVKTYVDNKLTQVTVNALSGDEVILSAHEQNGTLFLFLQQRGLTVTPDTLSIDETGGTVVVLGQALSNAITIAVQSGDFLIDGAQSKVIAAGNANSANTIEITYSGTDDTDDGVISVTCGDITKNITVGFTSRTVGYRLCDYIAGSGNAYIQTDYCPQINTKIEIDFIIPTIPSSVSCIMFGRRSATYGSNMCELTVCADNNQYISYMFGDVYSNANDSVVNKSYSIIAGTKYKVSTNGGTYTITPENGTGTTFTTQRVENDTNPSGNTIPLRIFTTNINNGTPSTTVSRSERRITSFKITEGDTVIHDYRAAIRKSDSVYGLYDMITSTFITSPSGYAALTGG